MTDVWSEIHRGEYAKSDWIDKPSIFAQEAFSYFPKAGKILELGAGQGQDSRFFAQHDYSVVSTDFEPKALELSQQKLPAELADRVQLQQVDLRELLPYKDSSFDVVYAHLSLHYFSKIITEQVFEEIRRVLVQGGILALLVNSKLDPEYGHGSKLEPDYFHVDGADKRYFTVESLSPFVRSFTTKMFDDQGETYKDGAKGVHNLIRFVGAKDD